MLSSNDHFCIRSYAQISDERIGNQSPWPVIQSLLLRKILGEFFHATNCKWIDRWNRKQHALYVKNLKGKPQERERIHYNISEGYNEFYKVILRLQSLGFDIVIRSQPLSWWRWRRIYTRLSTMGVDILDLHICMICTLWFSCNRPDLRWLIVGIAMQRYLPLSITTHIDIGAL